VIAALIVSNLVAFAAAAVFFWEWRFHTWRADMWAREAHRAWEEASRAAAVIERVARDKRRAEAN
jgi:hypothetical protein